ncbi:MAG: hypothetical protein MUC87_04140 [Bacteroidia bacterium]|jgi:hypothetical protein|nr:hypothetical protein [Bacteroidia bacterium]
MKKGLILSAVLFLPITIYLIFSLGVPKVKPAPVFGPRTPVLVKTKTGGTKTDTSYYHLPAFSFTDAEGRLHSGSELRGSLYIAALVERDSASKIFLYLIQDLKLNKGKWGRARFLFLEKGDSLGQKPAAGFVLENGGIPWDSVQLGALTPAAFDTLRDKHFFIETPGLAKQPWFTKSDFVLVDRAGRIRGYYNIRSAPELKRLREDISHVTFHDEALETLEGQIIEQRRNK